MNFNTILVAILVVKECRGFLWQHCNMHCGWHGIHYVCGSNGVTYDNLCFLEKAKCNGASNLYEVHGGHCTTWNIVTTLRLTNNPITTPTAANNPITTPTATTMSKPASTSSTKATKTTTTTAVKVTTTAPIGSTTTANKCAQTLATPCIENVDPVCGSDSNWYLNMCEFAKAYCNDQTLRFEHMGVC